MIFESAEKTLGPLAHAAPGSGTDSQNEASGQPIIVKTNEDGRLVNPFFASRADAEKKVMRSRSAKFTSFGLPGITMNLPSLQLSALSGVVLVYLLCATAYHVYEHVGAVSSATASGSRRSFGGLASSPLLLQV